MVERLDTRGRPEHTRSLLVDAAEEIITENRFTTASLDYIAYTAG